MGRRLVLSVLVVVIAGRASAEGAGWRDHVTLTRASACAANSSTVHTTAQRSRIRRRALRLLREPLRAGIRVLFPHVEANLELQDTRLTVLPDDATLPARRQSRPGRTLLSQHARHDAGRDVRKRVS